MRLRFLSGQVNFFIIGPHAFMTMQKLGTIRACAHTKGGPSTTFCIAAGMVIIF